MEKLVREYFKNVYKAYRLGNTETDYNAPIINLLTGFGCIARDLSGKRSGLLGENIDLKLWHSGDDESEKEPFAGIEVKKVNGIDNRAKSNVLIETKVFGNVILTDNLRWEFWQLDENDEPKMYTGLRLIDFNNGNLMLKEENIPLFISLVNDFMLKKPNNIQSSSRLAEYMAIHARTIRDIIKGILKENEENMPLVNTQQQNLPMFNELYNLFNKIRSELSSELKTNDFADMYAQTIVYGLFIARFNDSTPEDFNRNEALNLLQKESKLLKQFFIHITTAQEQHPTLIAVIDKLCELYQLSDLSALLDRDENRDTIIHFYEDFLSAYDSKLRKSLGVFYTPQPIVQYMVSMVDNLLVNELFINGGLSNNETFNIEVESEEYLSSKRKDAVLKNKKNITVPKVAILDPATGTGTFPSEVIKFVKKKYFQGNKAIFYEEWIERNDGLMSRLISFEIMMTSYVIAHLKIRRTIDETLGHSSKRQLPANIYLTNTLEPAHSTKERADEMNIFMDFSGAISDEAYHADKWKNRRPIKVIMGNPPYLAANKIPYNISAYRTETNGEPFIERNSKILDDLYIKFFRFSEEVIQKNNEGILAFITNNNYLDAPICRGMRASLLRTFDKIWIINLHGSAIKKEKTPDGLKDENVFDIMQGVAIFIGVKKTNSEDWAEVNYADLYGLRIEKFERLLTNSLDFNKVVLNKKTAAFIIQDENDLENYEKGISVSDLFNLYAVGVQTARDKLLIQKKPENIEIILKDLKFQDIDVFRQSYDVGKDQRDWSLIKAKNDIEQNEGKIVKINYRPFDERYTYYTGHTKGFHSYPRNDIMRHFLVECSTPIGQNIAMIFNRINTTSDDFATIFITDKVVDKGILGSVTKGAVAPLYLYNDIIEDWESNINFEALRLLTQNLDFIPESIEIFDYCYAILHDPSYRIKYNNFLKQDYPKVPIIENKEKFYHYVKAGHHLREIHLMNTSVESDIQIISNKSKNMKISKITYQNERIKINNDTEIFGISESVWNYKIGGYQVIDKWLKSYKNEVLDMEKFNHISNIVGIINETLNIQNNLKSYY